MRPWHLEPAPTPEVNSNTDIWGMHLTFCSKGRLTSTSRHGTGPRGWDRPRAGCGAAAFKSRTGKGDEKIKEMGQGRSYRCRHGRRRNNGADASRLSLVMEGLVFLG